MQIKDIMNRNVDVIKSSKFVFDAARMMDEGGYGAIPVEENDKMIGMITDRDIVVRVVAKGLDPKEVKVKECMTAGIDYCFENDDVEDLTDKMKESHHRRIPVVNDDKRLVGIVTLTELSKGARNQRLSHEVLQNVTH